MDLCVANSPARKLNPMPGDLTAKNLWPAVVNALDKVVVDLTQYGKLHPDGAVQEPGWRVSWTSVLRDSGESIGVGVFKLLVLSEGDVVELTMHVMQNERAKSVSICDAQGVIAEIHASSLRVRASRTRAGRRRRALGRRALFLLSLKKTGSAALFKAYDSVSELARLNVKIEGIPPHVRLGHYNPRPKGIPANCVQPLVVNVSKLPDPILVNEAVAGTIYVLVPDEDVRRQLVAMRSCKGVRDREILQDDIPRLFHHFDLPVKVNRCTYARTVWALTTVLAELAPPYHKPRKCRVTFEEAVRMLSQVIHRLA